MRHRDDNVRTIGYVQFNLSPLGLHMWADHYLDCYRDQGMPEQESSLMSSLLLCRAIELELKAWHRQTTKQAELKDNYRHDLMTSYRALPAKHRILSADEVGLLTRASEIYGKQGFEHIGVDRSGRRLRQRVDLAALDAMTQKIMEYGDRLSWTCD